MARLISLEPPPLCPKCPHEVREHQPVNVGRGHLQEFVYCQRCDCLITMLAKLKAWGARRK
ncbi:MAG: hypothetical protein LN413_07025 [Candidatus Thermoplasmatota archaeon]|nr:hypothetical protein [Candidatus Thermoplasmatota archaeon]